MADFPAMDVSSMASIPLFLPFDEGIPILFEDDAEPDMGESNLHTITAFTLHRGLMSHLREQPDYQAYGNMNLHYLVRGFENATRLPYVSPDIMIVQPYERLPKSVASYRLNHDGPAPALVVEILSERTAHELDLTVKVELYRIFGVREYILVDNLGDLLPQRLLLKRLRSDATWEDLQDADGGVTSLLGFRMVIEATHHLRLVHAKTGYRYLTYNEYVQLAEGPQREGQPCGREGEQRSYEKSLAQIVEETKQAEAKCRAAMEDRKRLEQEIREIQEETRRIRGERPSE